MKNPVIEQQILNAIMFNRTFLLNCRAAALKNDGVIDRDEEKTLKKLEAAVNKYITQLDATR